MTFSLYVDIGAEFPLEVSPIRGWARALIAIAWFRKHGHNLRMVCIDRNGKVITRDYEGIRE